MRRDPWGNPSFHPRLTRGWNAHTWKLSGELGLDYYDGPTVIASGQLAGFWFRLAVRLWYSERMWQRSSDRWTAETLAGEHAGITVGVEHHA